MTTNYQVTTLTLLQQTMKVKCPQALVPELHKSLHYLETQLAQVAENYSLVAHEKLLILAALNSIQTLSQENEQLLTKIDELNDQLQTQEQTISITQQEEMAL